MSSLPTLGMAAVHELNEHSHSVSPISQACLVPRYTELSIPQAAFLAFPPLMTILTFNPLITILTMLPRARVLRVLSVCVGRLVLGQRLGPSGLVISHLNISSVQTRYSGTAEYLLVLQTINR